jgi:hypothetical protein
MPVFARRILPGTLLAALADAADGIPLGGVIA